MWNSFSIYRVILLAFALRSAVAQGLSGDQGTCLNKCISDTPIAPCAAGDVQCTCAATSNVRAQILACGTANCTIPIASATSFYDTVCVNSGLMLSLFAASKSPSQSQSGSPSQSQTAPAQSSAPADITLPGDQATCLRKCSSDTPLGSCGVGDVQCTCAPASDYRAKVLACGTGTCSIPSASAASFYDATCLNSGFDASKVPSKNQTGSADIRGMARSTVLVAAAVGVAFGTSLV